MSLAEQLQAIANALEVEDWVPGETGINTRIPENVLWNPGCTLLGRAVEVEREDLIQTLLDLGADIQAAPGERGDTPLHRAVKHATPEIVEMLLRSGADVHARNTSGETPLLSAAMLSPFDYERTVKLAELLLTHGADVNARSDYGKTPIRWAEDHGHLVGGPLVEFFLAHGAKPFDQQGGDSDG